jgi:HAD superfamily hydrolase (TIGR01490 family)
VHGPLRVARALIAATARHKANRDLVKVALLRSLFRGFSAVRLEEEGRTFAATLAAGMRPALRERLEWHRSMDHRVVIVSASLGAYLRPFGESLGVDGVLAVEMESDGDGVLTGEIVGLNVRGAEKLERLRAWLTDAEVELWAYGDSRGDLELLLAADHPTWVKRKRVR